MNRVSPLAGVLFLLILVAILAMGPWTGASFTILDNMLPELYANRDRSLLEIGLDSFSHDRRIQSLFFWPLEMLPSLPGTSWAYAAFKLGFLSLAFCSFGLLVGKLVRSPILGAGATLLAVGSIQNQTDFDIINAFCVVFPLALSLAFLACCCAISYGRVRRTRDLVFSVLLYLGSLLLYEAFITLPALLLGLAWLQPLEGSGPRPFREKVRSFLLPTGVFAAVAITFTATFFLIKKAPEEMPDDWTKMGSTSPVVLAKTGWQYALGGVPGYHALNHRSPYNQEILFQAHGGKDAFSTSPANWIRALNSTALVKGLAVAAGLVLCMAAASVNSFRSLVPMLLAGGYFALAPAMTSSVSAIHQIFVESQGRLAHNTSNFSHFGWVLLIMAGLAAGCALLRNARLRILRVAFFTLTGVLALASSLLADFWNAHTNRIEARTAARWTAAKVLVGHPAFASLHEKATIHAPELSRGRTRQERDFYDISNYWSEYYAALSGKSWELTRTPEQWSASLADSDRRPFRFLWVEDAQQDEQHAFLASVDSQTPDWAARLSLFRFSAHRAFRISGPAQGTWISVGGLRVAVENGYFQFDVSDDGARGGVSLLTIESDQPLHLPSIVLSTPFSPTPIPRVSRGVEISYGEHFMESTMRAGHRDQETIFARVSRSNSNQASLSLHNARGEPVQGTLRMSVRSFGRGTLKIATGGEDHSLTFAGPDEEVKSFEIPVNLRRGEQRVELSADFAGKGDAPWVAFELVNVRLELE